jgi:tryprostatin B 6-hydroxylase
MNVSKWFHYYSFDIVGDLAFGKSFDMLKNGRIHFAIELLERGMAASGVLTPISWMIPVMAAAPIIGSEYRRLCDWCAEQVEQRRKMKVDVPDITSWLLKDPRGDRRWLTGDARLIVVAGSDATAVAMTHVFYHLAAAPPQAERLRAELKTLINPSAPFSVGDVRHADHLNGVINEALRLHPPVPSGTYRITPPQGITVDGVYLPGEVNITLPHYVIGRCKQRYRYFPSRNE